MNTQVMILDTTCVDDEAATSTNQMKLHRHHRPTTIKKRSSSSTSSSVCSNSTRGSRRSSSCSSSSVGSCSTTSTRKSRALRFQSPTAGNCSKSKMLHLQRSTPYDNYHDVLMSPDRQYVTSRIGQPSTPRTPRTVPAAASPDAFPITPSPLATPVTSSVPTTPYVVDDTALACFDLFEVDAAPSTQLPPLPPTSSVTKNNKRNKMERNEVPLTQLVDYNDNFTEEANHYDEDDLQSKATTRTVSTCSVSTTGSASPSSSPSRTKDDGVAFQKTITVHEVPSRKNQLKHKDQIWYTKKEAEVMKQNVYVMTRLLKSNLVPFDNQDQNQANGGDDDDELCSWGLNQGTAAGINRGNQNLDSSKTKTQLRRIDTIKTVLEEQQLQREMNNMNRAGYAGQDHAHAYAAKDYAMNSELLATIYHTMTKSSSIEAHQRGVDMYNELRRSSSSAAAVAAKASTATDKKNGQRGKSSKHSVTSASPMRRASLNLFRKS